uniref:Small multi-drug export protein n=1 Tax=Oryza punctata TaxID=4537 RepID=A0A0E0KKA5_ORYPU
MAAASVLAASSSSPPPLALASWRWRPPPLAVAVAAPGATNPRLTLRLSAAASLPVTGESRAVARTRCLVAPLGGGETEWDAATATALDWGALARRMALGALGCAVLCGGGAAMAAEDSIKASGFGLRVAASLRRLGWPDEAVVFTLATLPVIELRGAIPVGYWMQLDPIRLTVLSVLGNMVPVPFIILYLKKLATFLSQRSASATRIMDLLFERARRKAAPVEEFQWLGLMLFVAVPFPGTGAWTGAIISSVLGMPFWSGFSANFVGVVLAGLLVNLLMNLGLKYAIITGLVLFFVSTVMWGVLRSLKKSLNAK